MKLTKRIISKLTFKEHLEYLVKAKKFCPKENEKKSQQIIKLN